MKKVYVASICKNGILGGGLYIDKEKITYRTGKITVPARLRNLELYLNDIKSMEKARVLGFPAVIIRMKNGENWKFIIFARQHFLKTVSLHEADN